MKASGIIAEYNPFHKGHAYQIEQLRAQSDTDVVIAIMSGNFLQRGEPAILDKWIRTQMALAGGIDLVIELPVIWSVQPADYFAKGAIKILSALNIDYLSFGVEDGNQEDFYKAGRFMVDHEQEIEHEIELDYQMNLPYAKKMENILLKLNPEFPVSLASPNSQLGLSYQKELIKLGLEKEIATIPVKRKGAGYHKETLDYTQKIASATALRKAIFQKESIHSYIPDSSYQHFTRSIDQSVSWKNYYPYLKYQLLLKSVEELRAIYQMTEGLENRLKKYIEEASTFEEFMNKVKTKRYTQTRLQRLFTYILLDITTASVDLAFQKESSIRILGFNAVGQAYLNQEKNKINNPILSNINQKTKSHLIHDIRAGNIYRLGHSLIEKQDFTRMPLKFD